MGDHRRLMVSPPVPLAAGTAQESAALGEVFLEVGRPREPGPTTAPRRGDTPAQGRAHASLLAA